MLKNEKCIETNLDFILACCQIKPDFLQVKDFLLREKMDLKKWDSLISLAYEHGVFPLFYIVITEVNNELDIIDESISEELKRLYIQIVKKSMMMTSELVKLMKVIEEENICALAFKGPVLSQIAYGNISLRQYVDLDILIRKEEIFKVERLLKNYGYEKLFKLTKNQEKKWLDDTHDIGFINKVKDIHCEVHWSFLDEDFPMQIELKPFFEETQLVKMPVSEVRTFSNENLLYYLCIHGSKHLWERVEWLNDIDRLIRGYDINWNTIIDKADKEGFAKMFYLGLALCNRYLDTPLPKPILEHINKYNFFNTLIADIYNTWTKEYDVIESTRFIALLFPKKYQQISYIAKTIFKPTLNEYKIIDLPRSMYFGYYFIRLYLLIKKYFQKFV